MPKRVNIVLLIILAVAVVFLSVGILLSVLSTKSKDKEAETVKNCTETCNAVIVDVIDRDAVEVNERWYNPVFEYTVDGKTYTVTSKKSYMTNWWNTGQVVEIRYNPQDPEMIYYPQYEKGNYKILKIMGIVFILVGILVIVVAGGMGLMLGKVMKSIM